jgi:hypothetical protein
MSLLNHLEIADVPTLMNTFQVFHTAKKFLLHKCGPGRRRNSL